MSVTARKEAVISNVIAIMENSSMLSLSQKRASSGKDKDQADSIRGHFLALAEAATRPQFCTADQAEEPANQLSDAYAMQLPAQLQAFLPEDQSRRLVGSVAISIASPDGSAAHFKPRLQRFNLECV